MPKGLLTYWHDHADSFDGVFVDVFDTLLVRTVEPEYVKRLVSLRVAQYFSLPVHADDLYALRRRRERLLCEFAVRQGLDAEFRLRDLLADLYHELRRQEAAHLDQVSLEEFVRVGTLLECETECAVQRADPDVAAFLQELAAREVPAFAVTDTYLPRESLERMLSCKGLLGCLRDLFISSETLESKRSGRLYDRVLERVRLSADRVLMVGDSEHADRDSAAARGLTTYLLDRSGQRSAYAHFLAAYADPARVRREIMAAVGRDGLFPEIALSFYAFVARLHTKLVARRAADVLFFSREGEFLRELFDAYQDAQGCADRVSLRHVRARYLMVSRRSTFIASLRPIDAESFETLFRQYRRISLGEFLRSLNFPDADIAVIAAALGVDANQREADFPTSDAFCRLKDLDAFRDAYERIRSEQRELLLAYLRGFDVAVGGVTHVVDIGWKGTIQDHLFHALGGTTWLRGYYLGLTEYGDAAPLNAKDAILFDRTAPLGNYDVVYNANRALFEVFTEASHGSARHYARTETGIAVLLDDDPAEKALYEGTIRPLQIEILDRFRRIAGVLSRCALAIDSFADDFARAHFRLVYQPTREERDFFRRLHHAENFGVFEETRFDRAAPVPLGRRLRNLAALVRSPSRTLSQGWWAPLTLDDMGLAFLLPIYGHVMRRKLMRSSQAASCATARAQHATLLELQDGIRRQSDMIAERDAYIRKLEKLAVERMNAMDAQTRMIDERDAYIRQLEDRLRGARGKHPEEMTRNERRS